MVYSQENITDNKFKRVFSSEVSEKELVWHRDKENRIVEVLEDTDWYFQMDNELPIPLKKGVKFQIPKVITFVIYILKHIQINLIEEY